MKINWGTGIIIAFALFISFILYFVFKVQSDSKYDNEMVVDEYYKVDARYGEEMKKEENARDLPSQPEISQTADGILIVFPDKIYAGETKGTVAFYRPSNEKLDFEKVLKLNDGQMLIPNSQLVTGRWRVTLLWEHSNTSYKKIQNLYFK